MKFIDIFYEGKNLPPQEQQTFKSKIFEREFASISQNTMTLWQLGDELPRTETSFLLGVCPNWNLYDLYLLDCINDSLKKAAQSEFIGVFDLDSLSIEDLLKIFGNIVINAPPILGIWEDNLLQKSLHNWDAKHFLIEKFDFEWQPPKIYLNQ